VTRRCKRCRSSFNAKKHFHELCWACWRAEREKEQKGAAFREGFKAGLERGQDEAFQRGYEAGRRAALPADSTLRGAIALCHPDRHPPERGGEANRITAALLSLRAAPSRADAEGPA
jgi:hypothetical protein